MELILEKLEFQVKVISLAGKHGLFSNLKTMQFDLQKLKLHPLRVKVGQWEGQLLLHDKNKILG